jgi:DNA polymerase elongation subunit (family B)
LKPNLLFVDIETTPNLVWAWGTGKQYISYDSIKKEKEVICICYKWNNGPVEALVFDQKKYDLKAYDDEADKRILEQFSEQVSKADVIIGHNVKEFDMATMNARLFRHKLPPFTPTLIDDTLLQSYPMRLNSYRLDYLGQYTGEGRKTKTDFSWWVRTCEGDKKALADMVRYCKQDTNLLAKIYARLFPYIKTSLNLSIFDGRPNICRYCGEKNTLIVRGYYYTDKGKYAQYQCKRCNKYQHGGENLIKKSAKYPR